MHSREEADVMSSFGRCEEYFVESVEARLGSLLSKECMDFIKQTFLTALLMLKTELEVSDSRAFPCTFATVADVLLETAVKEEETAEGDRTENVGDAAKDDLADVDVREQGQASTDPEEEEEGPVDPTEEEEDIADEEFEEKGVWQWETYNLGFSEQDELSSQERGEMSKQRDKISKQEGKLAKQQDEMSKKQDEMSKSQNEMSKSQDEMSNSQDEMSKQENGTTRSASFRFSCETCGKRFRHKYWMEYHEARDHYDGGLENHPKFSRKKACGICQVEFPIHELYRHRASHETPKCSHCGKVYPSKNALQRHVNRMHELGKEVVGCGICGKRYTRFNLQRHLQLAHRPTSGRFKCSKCLKTFLNQTTLRKHASSIHNEDLKYVCSVCGKKCSSAAVLRAHEDSHNDVKRHACETCHKSFTNSYSFRKHVVKEHGVGLDKDPEFSKEVSCDVCGQGMPFHKLYDHKSSHRTYPCKICGKALASSTSRKHHMAIIHDGDTDRIECEVCGKSVRHFYLTSHMTEYHSQPQDMLKCSICSKTFVSKLGLRKHVEYMHDEGCKHVCSVCGKKCPSASRLSEHEDSHSDVKRHVCEQCGKAYKYRKQLLRHVQLDHEGKVLYKCKDCGKVYRQSQHLKRHVTRQHPTIQDGQQDSQAR
ncbi:unnamed protein product [Cyprideis torosa]|uniref:Uncharacterized protein n=1 Tax=Cyprideis torosa TaxID=163714 RepID=A0A7R8W7C5_9CRUS|nr:unnamed protein product [Cyprideis torosa]CAG0887432.1 unnamed protein product [Cyprideis torosa]